MANVPTTLSSLTAQNEITQANLWLACSMDCNCLCLAWLISSQQCFSLTPNQPAVLQPWAYKPIQPKWTGCKWLNKDERQQRQSTQTRTVENAAVMQKPQQGQTLQLQNRSALFANRLGLFLWEAQEEPTWPVSEPACPVSLPSSPREKGKIPNMLKSISAEAKLLVRQKTANNQPQGHLPKVLHMDSELVAPKHPFVHTRTFSHQMPSVLGLMSMLSINLIPYRIFHQSRTWVLSEMLFPVFLFLVRTYVWAVARATL